MVFFRFPGISSNIYRPQGLPSGRFANSPFCGMSQPQQSGLGLPLNRAPIVCNCCHCKYDTCAQFWAIYNLLQVYMCYFMIAMRHLFWEWADAISKNPKLRENKTEECFELYHVVGTPPTNIIFSIEVLLLFLYTIGSLFFAAAVFHRKLNPQDRSKFLIIYIVLLACLPLALFVPLFIRYYLCTKAGFGNLIINFVWLVINVIFTLCAAHAAWVIRKWVLDGGNNMPVPLMPQPQPQIQGSTTDTNQELKTSWQPEGGNE